MKRRTLLLGGGAVLAAAGAGLILTRSATGEPVSLRTYGWNGADFRAGGTAGLPSELPVPAFRAAPNCTVLRAATLGPCHTEAVPVRQDVTEGVSGLPTRIALRLVEGASCTPVEGADIEIWHADQRGVYSGRAAAMCNAGDAPARQAGFLRGRQITDADGRAMFLTVYPGWYRGRAVHVHLRIVVEGRELLISQLLFDDTLSDLIYRDHPDYKARPVRDTLNGGDTVFAARDVPNVIFDVEKLDGGVLQASFTIGIA